jgi:hypothetical protein
MLFSLATVVSEVNGSLSLYRHGLNSSDVYFVLMVDVWQMGKFLP